MKYLSTMAGLVLFLITPYTFANTAATPDKNMTVDVSMNYSVLGEDGKKSESRSNNTVNLSSSQSNWTVIARSQSAGDQQKEPGLFMLLGKLEKANAHNAKMKFMTIALNSKNQVAMEKTVSVTSGKKAALEFDQDGVVVHLEVMAHR